VTTLNTQKLDWVLENSPHHVERVRVMIRATRLEVLQFQQDAQAQRLQQLFIRRATEEDYREGMTPANLNVEQVVAQANR
jgi:hypothetical protein